MTRADGGFASDAEPSSDLGPEPERGPSSTPEPAAEAGSETYRGLSDVHEWAAEVRRRYVEPKTRAMMREEGAITPRKRRRRLFGGPDSADRDAAAPDVAPDA